jgi:prevent-host-death family protein
METVSIRDLRNKGGEVIDRVTAGGAVTITRDGRPVAELRPLRARGLPSAVLLERWRRVPTAKHAAMKRDIDRVIDPRL